MPLGPHCSAPRQALPTAPRPRCHTREGAGARASLLSAAECPSPLLVMFIGWSRSRVASFRPASHPRIQS